MSEWAAGRQGHGDGQGAPEGRPEGVWEAGHGQFPQLEVFKWGFGLDFYELMKP